VALVVISKAMITLGPVPGTAGLSQTRSLDYLRRRFGTRGGNWRLLLAASLISKVERRASVNVLFFLVIGLFVLIWE
jgi:hypothetical protein